VAQEAKALQSAVRRARKRRDELRKELLHSEQELVGVEEELGEVEGTLRMERLRAEHAEECQNVLEAVQRQAREGRPEASAVDMVCGPVQR
jgi:predicted  nucleic acid-binding Zn-ribbon protein